MGVYIIKRVFLMVPTFFAISLVVFVVLNFAPGTPGSEILGTGQSGQTANLAGQQRESYRIFKEQFNLDEPVLLNTRFALKPSRIRATLAETINLGGTVAPKRRIRSQEEIGRAHV